MKHYLIKGQSATIQSTVYTDDGNQKANLTSATITFMLKANPTDLDSQALLTKNVGTGVTIINPTEGICSILLTASDTNTLSYQSLYFEILVKLSTGAYIRTGIEELILNKNLIKTLN